MNTDTDRERGLLTEADREFLLGEVEMEHEQSKRNAAARIRRRIENGILDFDLLVHYLDGRDRRQVFDAVAEDEAFLDGLAAMVSFAYIGLKEQGVDFERVLEPAVRGAETAYAVEQLSSNVEVDVTFEVETDVNSSLSGIEERIADGTPVSPGELFSLVMERETDLVDRDRITLRVDGGPATENEHVDRLADYLDAAVRYPNDSLAVLHWDGE
ncbi:hypothetical protein G9464_05675 [Halostella sp. JP-L12]|uniref:hypothetical protein n=1 Tax=Halostella TaxID=1843185 RepID=UPI000EF82A0C|nr:MULTISPECIES: hypothetical protein [Halostella]NHN47087.1 hypothetical protein [Halostella sp. JP-L12]